MFQERISGPKRLMWISFITLMLWMIHCRELLMIYTHAADLISSGQQRDECPLSDRELDRPRGWYGVKMNGGPTSYHFSLRPLAPLITSREITSIQRGDLIHVERSARSSELSIKSRGQLNARELSALNIPISVNHGSARDLTQVKGIGTRRARQIVRGRPWRSIDDLTRIRGVGAQTVRRLKRHLTAKSRVVIWEREQSLKTMRGATP